MTVFVRISLSLYNTEYFWNTCTIIVTEAENMLEMSKKVNLKVKRTPREEDIFPLRKRDKLKTIEEMFY